MEYTERDRFEQWYCDDANRYGYGIIPSDIESLRAGNEYGERVALNSKWEGWQARASLDAAK